MHSNSSPSDNTWKKKLRKEIADESLQTGMIKLIKKKKLIWMLDRMHYAYEL